MLSRLITGNPKADVLQVAGVETGRLKGLQNGNLTSDLQMAADRAVFILCAVRCYLRYSLSLRDVEELLDERGLQAGHYDGVALGTALCTPIGATTAAAPLVLPVSRDRFRRCHH